MSEHGLLFTGEMVRLQQQARPELGRQPVGTGDRMGITETGARKAASVTDTQKTLFSEDGPTVVNCTRCAKRCRAVAKRNPDAQLFVKGDAKTGRFCAECTVVDFFKNCDSGPMMGLVEQFDPEGLRLPHVQELFSRIVAQAQTQYGAELSFGEIDWNEVIDNWRLPFPKKKRRRRKNQSE